MLVCLLLHLSIVASLTLFHIYMFTIFFTERLPIFFLFHRTRTKNIHENQSSSPVQILFILTQRPANSAYLPICISSQFIHQILHLSFSLSISPPNHLFLRRSTPKTIRENQRSSQNLFHNATTSSKHCQSTSSSQNHRA